MRKQGLLAVGLTAVLLLSGCSAMLERSYVSVEEHNENPASDGGSALRVESYQELVSAILYCVSNGEETGVIRLYNYPRDVESDLESACLEVVQEDPLGAYAVDYIRHEIRHIVSYYEATVHIAYRRTAEQIASVVSVTGVTAIRSELGETMQQFQPELVLRIGSFDEASVNLQQVVREAYYDTPLAAFGMPEASFTMYPAETTGSQRVVEVKLTYPEDVALLREKQQVLQERADSMKAMLTGTTKEAAARTAFAMVRENAVYGVNQDNTAYGALVEGAANSEGFALAFQLLCDMAQVECTVVEGTRGGEPYMWNEVNFGSERYAVDTTTVDGFGMTDEQLSAWGYVPQAAA